MVENHLLINEIQLGNKLNECVHSQRRSDFSLMLAMLTDDAREFSEFALPNNEDVNLSDEQYNELALRKTLNLPEIAPLALSDVTELEQFNEALLVEQQNIASINLANALKPKALSFRNNQQHIARDIINNTSIHTQKRYESDNSILSKRLNFNTVQWLNVVKQASVATLLADVKYETIDELT